MAIRFGKLAEVPTAALMALLNEPANARQMPLAGAMDETACRAWAAAKDRQWVEHGYGPWAIWIDGRFAGWGGFQRDGDDADLALVLSPDAWGHGPRLVRELIARGWSELGLSTITIQLPPSRRHLRPLARLGFIADGTVDSGGHTFNRFRLDRPTGLVAAERRGGGGAGRSML